MKYIEIENIGTNRGAPFWFAVEEHVARNWADDEYFVIWQVDPCVMVGRNQLIDNEIDIDFCRRNNIAITRRKSGGGCIFSDHGCLLFSYINNGGDAASIFEQRMRDTAHTLAEAGIGATLSGRNDILVDDHKVAGAAIYRCGDRVIMHNSMLFNTDFEQMRHAITPSQNKLQSKGVASVSQRVGNVGDYTQLTINEYAAIARRTICGDRSRRMTADDLQDVACLEKEIASDRFIFGCNPRHSVIRRKRIEGVGSIEAHIELRNNILKSINFTGDFFLLGDIDKELFAPLKSLEFTPQAVDRALAGTDPATVVRGLDKESLLTLLFENDNKQQSNGQETAMA